MTNWLSEGNNRLGNIEFRETISRHNKQSGYKNHKTAQVSINLFARLSGAELKCSTIVSKMLVGIFIRSEIFF